MPDEPPRSAPPMADPLLGLVWWGSDCDACGNATYQSMQCDSCLSTLHTRKLWKEQG